MHLIDARALPDDHEFAAARVCVVGAGAAGVYLSHRLAELGCSVMLLEAGGEKCVDGETLGMGLDVSASTYRGATLGRAFGLGGTTSRWGGQLVPYSESDTLRESPNERSIWQHVVEMVQRHAGRVREELGVGSERAGAEGPFSAIQEPLQRAGLTVMASDWLPHHQRNLSRLLRTSYPRGGQVQVLLNAVARAWSFSPAPTGELRVDALTIRSNGRDFRVRSPCFVITAGTIESARILLEMQRGAPQSPFLGAGGIGRGLTDHLSSSVADVPASSRSAIIEAFGPSFRGGHMQSARILETLPPRDAARGFFHFVFDIDSAGFQVARKVFAGLQARRYPGVSAGELLEAAGGLAALGWDRAIRKRLHVPSDTCVRLQLDIEQVPRSSSRVSLKNDPDKFERPVAEVTWSVSDADLEQAARASSRLARAWASAPSLPPLDFKPPVASELKPHDAYHPVGVCRLGSDADAVVDPELRVRGSSNLWLLSTGIFPSAGTANPAFSMLCMGEQLAVNLAKAVAA